MKNNTSDKKILLIEDDPDDAGLIAKYLTSGIGQNFSIDTVGTLKEAVDSVKKNEFDAILLDLNLPDSKGLATFQKLKETVLNMPILLLTATEDDRLAVAAVEKGAQDYLYKNELTGPILSRAICYAIQRQRMMIADFAECKRAISELQNSEERFREMAENIREVFWMRDVEKNQMIYISPGYEEVWGRTCESLYASPNIWAEALFPEDRDRVLKNATSKQVAGEYNEEYRIVRPDGTIRWIWDRAFPIKNTLGQVYRVVGIAEDMTEEMEAKEKLRKEQMGRKKLEEQLYQSQKMEAIGGLAGGIAHDFNNILNVILGYSDMLAKDAIDGTVCKDDIEEIRKAGKRAASLTQQLLAFSRRQALQPRTFMLNEELEDLGKMLIRLMGENISLSTTLAPDLGFIYADQGQIQQVIMNLAINARDAMPKGGTFSIETKNVKIEDFSYSGILPPNDYVRLKVKDTGVGMSAEIQPHIFEPFFTTKEKGKGTGLGLSMAYGVIKQSQGFIFVESAVREGATFTIYLPKVSHAVSEEPVSTKVLQRLSGTGDILVIEDEESVRKLIGRVLSENEFKAHSAATGQEALSLIEEVGDKLVLVLADIVLPDIGGDEVVKRISEKHPNLKVIFMSGYLNKNFGDFTIDESVSFLQKPFSPEDLMQKINSVLNVPTPSRP